VLALLVHRLHYGTDDPGKDRTTARAAKRIGDETTQCPSGSRVGSSSTPKEATKQGSLDRCSREHDSTCKEETPAVRPGLFA
jgi:hypothetical protein